MRIAETFAQIAGPTVPVRFTAFDGSTAGVDDPVATITVRSPKAVAYLVQSPGELGMARAYVAGELDVDGDLHSALMALWAGNIGNLTWAQRRDALKALGPSALRYAQPPGLEVRRLPGRRHSKRRDAQAISHHYDVSNRFYEWILGPSMAYTCACYPTADSTLEEAQYEKFDLVARKLGLQEGQRLLDVGCGWGGMVMHAAREYGVQAIGVTLSRKQAEWASKAIAEAGLSDRAEVRFLDYRDVVEGDFDAVSSIGLTEHIGRAQLPAYFGFLLSKLRPGGRLLNHCIMRPTSRDPLLLRRGFINRYVFPDGELMALGPIVKEMQDVGFEVRHSENLREHYAMTLRDWSRNLDAHWDEAVREVGEERARVWRLYLAGSRLGFDRNLLQLHQVLAVKPDEMTSHMPLRPTWGS